MNRDELGKTRWNDSYVLTRDENLWGDPPVPWVRNAIELFSRDGARKVLDLPCGDGRNLPPLTAAFATVAGADASRNALAIAGRRATADAIDNLVLLEADIYTTSFTDDLFDGVFCCDVLGHLERPEKAIAELLRVCRPGHRVVANIFALEDSTRGDNQQQIGPEEYIYDDRFYFHYYSREDAEELVNGFAAAADVESLELVRWMEPPHEGYREYEHEHASWLFTLRKH